MMQFNILSIIIFGSSARGENDAYSDVDVCVITSDQLDHIQINLLKEHVQNSYNLACDDMIVYSTHQIDNMVKYGSLFLWHIKLEGKILYDNGYFKRTFEMLTKYDKHLSELHYHSELLSDVTKSFEKYSIINELDLSQLFTICRNACMIISHYNNKYAFGRQSAFLAASHIYADLPLQKDEYDDLAKWKLRYERGLYDDMKLPSLKEFRELTKITKNLLYFGIKKVSSDR